jgi:serine/threonine protein kinase
MLISVIGFYANEAPDDPQTAIDVRSPELLLTNKISSSQDIWSFGCIVYRFLTNITLFSLFDMGNFEALNDSHVL